MVAPAGTQPASPLGAPPCRLDPKRWEVPGASEHQIRKAAALCGRCPIRDTFCADWPVELRPRGMILGGMVVAVRDGKLHHPDHYLRYVRRSDRPARREDIEKQYLHGIDLSEVELTPDVLREILRGEITAPPMNRKTRKLAIAIAVSEMHLGDTAIARILLSTGGKPQPKSIERVRKGLGLPQRGGAPNEPRATHEHHPIRPTAV